MGSNLTKKPSDTAALVLQRGFMKSFTPSGEQKGQTELGLQAGGQCSASQWEDTLPCKEADQEIIGGNNWDLPSASFILGSNNTIQTSEFGEGECYRCNTLNNLNSSEQWHHCNTCLLAKCI